MIRCAWAWCVASTVLLAPAGSARAAGVDVLAAGVTVGALEAVTGAPGDVAVAVKSQLDDTSLAQRLIERVVTPLREALATREGCRRVQLIDAGESGADDAREAAGRAFHHLVHIEVRVEEGFVIVGVRVFRTGDGSWLALLRPRIQAIAHFDVRARVDAELGAYVGARPRVLAGDIVATPAPLHARGYVTAVALDMDGDGRDELVLVRVDRVDVLTVRDLASTTPVGSASLTHLRAAPSRRLRPVGTAVPLGRRALVALSHHATPFLVALEDGRVTAQASTDDCPEARFPLQDGCGAAAAGRDYFVARIRASDDTPRALAPSNFYARAVAHVTQRDGSEVRAEALVTPRGRLVVRMGATMGGARGYGTALAMTDLEDDGDPELLTSSDAAPGEGDQLRLLRMRQTGALIRVWRSPAIAGAVWVAGAGDFNGDGRNELFAIEEPLATDEGPARLWIVR